MRVLIIEDDPAIREFLVRGLTEEGFAVDWAADGAEGRYKAQDPVYDLIILDLMLPGMSGLTLLRELRHQKNTVPILVLTAKDTVRDRVLGLDSGADDYLVKPFAFDELLARARALLRRMEWRYDPMLKAGPIRLDRGARQVQVAGTRVDLSVREFAILEFFMQNPGEALSRTRIYEHVWNEHMEPSSNLIDVHVKELRRKLGRAGAKDVIATIRGVGYRLEGAPT